jgi:hypothetical protein
LHHFHCNVVRKGSCRRTFSVAVTPLPPDNTR